MARATAAHKQIHFFADEELYKRILAARMKMMPEPMNVNRFVEWCVERGVADVSKKRWKTPPAKVPRADDAHSIHFSASMDFYRKIHVIRAVFPKVPTLKDFVVWCVERGIDEVYDNGKSAS